MRLLDLFCGAGGAAVGYANAGFEVVGVDIEPQPNYPYESVQYDALKFLDDHVIWDSGLHGFDAIHTSPPCQAYTTMGQRFPASQAQHPDLVAKTRALLQQTALPYVIENVMGARGELHQPIRLCGSSFGLGVWRHRLFECSFPVMPLPCAHNGRAREPKAVYGKLDGRRLWTRSDGSELRMVSTLEEGQEAMGIDWMEWDELKEAIPPAMTEHIGHYLMAEINAAQAA